MTLFENSRSSKRPLLVVILLFPDSSLSSVMSHLTPIDPELRKSLETLSTESYVESQKDGLPVPSTLYIDGWEIGSKQF